MTNFVNLSDVFITPDATASVVTFTGATTATTGVVGLLPEAQTGDTNSFLRGDAQWIGIGALTQEGELQATAALSTNSIYTLNPSAGTFSVTLPPATGSQDRIYFYGGANLVSASAVTIGVSSGFLNNMSAGTFMAQTEGQVLLAVDRGASEWDLSVLGAGASTTLSYMVASASTSTVIDTFDETNDLPIDTTAQIIGSNIINNGSGVYTLKAGGTYKISVQLGFTADGGEIIDDFQIYNITDSVFFGAPGQYRDFTGDSSPKATDPIGIIQTTVDTQVSVRPTANVDNNINALLQESSIVIEQLPSSEVVLAGMAEVNPLDYVSLRINDRTNTNHGDNLIEWDVADYDPDSLFDGTEIINIAKDGIYKIDISSTVFSDAAINDVRYVYLVKNYNSGTDQLVYSNVNNLSGALALSSYLSHAEIYSEATEYESISINWIGSLNAGDQIAAFFAIDDVNDTVRSGSMTIQQLPASTVINSNDLPTAPVSEWSDGDAGVWSAANNRFEPVTSASTAITRISNAIKVSPVSSLQFNGGTLPDEGLVAFDQTDTVIGTELSLNAGANTGAVDGLKAGKSYRIQANIYESLDTSYQWQVEDITNAVVLSSTLLGPRRMIEIFYTAPSDCSIALRTKASASNMSLDSDNYLLVEQI